MPIALDVQPQGAYAATAVDAQSADNPALVANTKQYIRLLTWSSLAFRDLVCETSKHKYYSIPEFKGAAKAAFRLMRTEQFRNAKRIFVDAQPCSRLLEQIVAFSGKDLFVPATRESGMACQVFRAVQAHNLPEILKSLEDTSTDTVPENTPARDAVETAFDIVSTYFVDRAHFQMEELDMVIVGVVAVSPVYGYFVGRGFGGVDLQLAMLQQMRGITSRTIVATICHDDQLIPGNYRKRHLFRSHDFPVDLICTPHYHQAIVGRAVRPQRIYWERVSLRRLMVQPLLELLRAQDPMATDSTLKTDDSDVEHERIQRNPQLAKYHKNRGSCDALSGKELQAFNLVIFGRHPYDPHAPPSEWTEAEPGLAHRKLLMGLQSLAIGDGAERAAVVDGRAEQPPFQQSTQQINEAHWPHATTKAPNDQQQQQFGPRQPLAPPQPAPLHPRNQSQPLQSPAPAQAAPHAPAQPAQPNSAPQLPPPLATQPLPLMHAPANAKDHSRWLMWQRFQTYGYSSASGTPLEPQQFRVPVIANVDAAANRLAETRDFQSAQHILIFNQTNTEAIGLSAIRHGKQLYVPAPANSAAAFYRVQPPPGAIGGHLLGGPTYFTDNGQRQQQPARRPAFLNVDAYGTGVPMPLDPENGQQLDMIVVGAMCAGRNGRIIGTGQGQTDLQFGILLEAGAVAHWTKVVVVVDDRQLLDELPNAWFREHDMPVDVIVTPTQLHYVRRPPMRPPGLKWHLLGEDRVQRLAVLGELLVRKKRAQMGAASVEPWSMAGGQQQRGGVVSQQHQQHQQHQQQVSYYQPSQLQQQQQPPNMQLPPPQMPPPAPSAPLMYAEESLQQQQQQQQQLQQQQQQQQQMRPAAYAAYQLPLCTDPPGHPGLQVRTKRPRQLENCVCVTFNGLPPDMTRYDLSQRIALQMQSDRVHYMRYSKRKCRAYVYFQNIANREQLLALRDRCRQVVIHDQQGVIWPTDATANLLEADTMEAIAHLGRSTYQPRFYEQQQQQQPIAMQQSRPMLVHMPMQQQQQQHQGLAPMQSMPHHSATAQYNSQPLQQHQQQHQHQQQQHQQPQSQQMYPLQHSQHQFLHHPTQQHPTGFAPAAEAPRNSTTSSSSSTSSALSYQAPPYVPRSHSTTTTSFGQTSSLQTVGSLGSAISSGATSASGVGDGGGSGSTSSVSSAASSSAATAVAIMAGRHQSAVAAAEVAAAGGGAGAGGNSASPGAMGLSRNARPYVPRAGSNNNAAAGTAEQPAPLAVGVWNAQQSQQ